MNEYISRLDTWLGRERSAYYQTLSKGASADEISSLESTIGEPLPELYKEFLMWRNGQSEESESTFQGLYALMSVSETMSTIELMRELLETEEDFNTDVWNPKWVPFLYDGSGNHICIDLAGSSDGSVGQIVEYIHDDYPRPILFPSFEAWLQNAVTTFEQGSLQ